MNNDIQTIVNELNSTTPKTQMYMVQLCRSAINNLFDLTDTIEENISSLQNSVVANTSTISGIQSSIDVINTNLSAYLGRIEALEDKTSNISKDVDGTTIESLFVDADGVSIEGDLNVNGVIMGEALAVNNDYGSGRFYIDDDGQMKLSNAVNGGTLITDGNISEYATPLYRHTLFLLANYSAGDYQANTNVEIINNSSTTMTFNELASYLSTNGYTRANKRIYTSGGFVIYGGTYYVTLGIYIDTSINRIYFVGVDGQEQRYTTSITSEITTQIV